MKKFEQQDNHNAKAKSKKSMRKLQNRQERRKSKRNLNHEPQYKVRRGYNL